MTAFTLVNMLTGRRDRYAGIDLEAPLTRQALRWLPRANWFPIGDKEFAIKIEHQGPTWANFHLVWNRDRIATRCFACLEPEASQLTWGMAVHEQAWFEEVKGLPEPKAPWIAVVVPDNFKLPVSLYSECIAIERAVMAALLYRKSVRTLSEEALGDMGRE